MDSFDNFYWLRSLDFVKRGIRPYNDDDDDSVYNYVVIIHNYKHFRINMQNEQMVMHIYNQYIRKYGYEFIKKNSRQIRNKTAKAWILYALEKYPEVISYRNNDFKSDIDNLLCRLDITDYNVMDVFKSYMPFLFDIDIYNFAYDNIDSHEFEYFYILLMWFYESDISGSEEEEIIDIQKKITLNFIKLAPEKIKDKALYKLYDSFKQINQTNLFEEKLCTLYDQILYGKEKPLTGTFHISWDKVEFYDGFYLIRHPRIPLSNSNLMFRVEDKNSRKIYNDVNKIFLKRLSPIHVESKNGKITKVLNIADLTECTLTLEHKTKTTFEKKKRHNIIQTKKLELTAEESKSFCKKFKSQFLNELCNQQLVKYKVICCIEYRINSSGVIHQEHSFIFTIAENKEKLYLAYENASNARCTYILPITHGTWVKSIENIYNFFASDEINKRQLMASRLIDLKLPGNYEYKRILHKDYTSWSKKIMVICSQ